MVATAGAGWGSAQLLLSCAAASMNLDGIFGVLRNVCWTSLGPIAVSEIGYNDQN